MNNLDTDGSEKIADGIFCIALDLKKRMNHFKIVINEILPRDEQNMARKQIIDSKRTTGKQVYLLRQYRYSLFKS